MIWKERMMMTKRGKLKMKILRKKTIKNEIDLIFYFSVFKYQYLIHLLFN
jgi:hypothetical protein